MGGFIEYIPVGAGGAGGDPSGPFTDLRIKRGTTQVITPAVAQTYIYNEIDYDVLDEWDEVTGTFTATIDGVYDVAASVTAEESWTVGEKFIMEVHVNGVLVNYLDTVYAQVTGALNSHLQGSCTVRMAAGDILNIQLFHDRGIALNTLANGGSMTDGQYNYITIALNQDLSSGFIPTPRVPTTTVYVNGLDNLPDPVGDVITLNPDTHYHFSNGLNFGSARMVISDGCQLSGEGVYSSGISYSGTGDFLTASNIGFTIDNLAVTCPNANQVLSVTGTFTNSMFADRFRIYDSTKLGSFDGAAMVMNNFVANRFVDGWSFTGGPIIGHSVVNAFLQDIDAGAVHFDFSDAVFLQLAMEGVEMEGTGTCFSSSVGGQANMIATTDAVINNCTMGVTAGMTPLSGFDDDFQTVGWEFDKCSPASLTENSREAVDHYLLSQNTITVSSSGVWYEMGVPAVGSWQSDIDDRFTVNADGSVTYNGNKEINIVANCTCTLEQSGGGADLLLQGIAINWITNNPPLGKSVVGTENTQPTQLVSIAETKISTGDNIRPVYLNDDDTSNIIVDRIYMLINEAG